MTIFGLRLRGWSASMAYAGGYSSGYGGGASTGWFFTPVAVGSNNAIVDQQQAYGRRSPLWRYYTIPNAIHILYTSGASLTRQVPSTDLMKAADPGSGKGDRMVWPSPGGPYPITEEEALTIIADETYADYVSGGA